jgi:hypothetical protein
MGGGKVSKKGVRCLQKKCQKFPSPLKGIVEKFFWLPWNFLLNQATCTLKRKETWKKISLFMERKKSFGCKEGMQQELLNVSVY